MTSRKIFVLLVSAAAIFAGMSSSQAASGEVTHTVVVGEQRLTLKLRPVNIRAPQFGVYVQQADGTLERTAVAPTRAYLGYVEGKSSWIAVAVRQRDGVLAGQLTSDGRATTFFSGSKVTGTRGTGQATYHWPSATGDKAARNVTAKKAQIEGFTRRWDVGYDLDYSYISSKLGGSVARAMDAVELTTVEMLATYESNARLRPAIGRVILRSAQAASPYAGKIAELGDVRAQWRSRLDQDIVDTVAYLHTDGGGGGVAYVGTVGGNYAVSLNGSGNSIAIIRHELGHTWGPGDNHTNGPEGQTIMSGNDYARFDGSELAAILATRDERLKTDPARFPRVGTSAIPLPPYATLDLKDYLRSGSTTTLWPTANDVDANGDTIRLRTVDARSHLGARLTRSSNSVVYRAPQVAGSRTLDWFRYRVFDSTGRSASGIVMMRVSPKG